MMKNPNDAVILVVEKSFDNKIKKKKRLHLIAEQEPLIFTLFPPKPVVFSDLT